MFIGVLAADHVFQLCVGKLAVDGKKGLLQFLGGDVKAVLFCQPRALGRRLIRAGAVI